MQIESTPLADVLLITPRVWGDSRGFFYESWNAQAFREQGLDLHFVQDNHSRSARGVLRGLHFQIDRPQGKLVRVVAGSAYDAVVDLRRSSPTFGGSAGFRLSADPAQMLWIPPGFAHGFLALEDATEFLYKCTDFYEPALERTLLWNDPTLAIDWPTLDVAPMLSTKDEAGLCFTAIEGYP